MVENVVTCFFWDTVYFWHSSSMKCNRISVLLAIYSWSALECRCIFVSFFWWIVLVWLSQHFRAAALRCRQKKRNFVTSLENKVAELQKVNDALEVDKLCISAADCPLMFRRQSFVVASQCAL